MQRKTQSWKDTKRTHISSRFGCSYSHSMLLCISHHADVLEVYMHQFWDSVYKHDTFYRFKMDKRKRFKLNLEVFKDIFKICPRVQGQDFDALPTDEEIINFAALINRSLSGKTTSLDKLRLSRAQILWSKRVKRPTKKSTKAPARGVVIKETPEMPLSKKKEKVDEVRKKSMRDFHKTHPSGPGTVTKTAPSAAKIKPSVTSEGTDDSNNEQDSSDEDSEQENNSDDNKTQSDVEYESDSDHETEENKLGSKSDHEENEEDEDDEEEVKDEFVKTPSNDSDDEYETKIDDKIEGDEDKEMDYTTSQLYDDVDIRQNELVDSDKGFVQEEGTDAAMTNIQQGNENPNILQVIEDAHVTLSTVPQKTEVLVTSSSHSSDLAAKFLNFSDIPHTDAEVVSLMDVHVHHEVPSQQIPKLLTLPVLVIDDSSPVLSTVIPQSFPSFIPPPQQSTFTPPTITKATNPSSTLPNFASVFQFNNRVTALKKEVVELKKDGPLKTQVTALVDEHLDTRMGATRDEFMNFLSASLTARITKQMVKESLEDAVLAKESSQPQSSYKGAATLTEFELKKILINKIDKSESYLAAPEHRECYEGLKKSYGLDKTYFYTYGKVYSLKRSRKNKDEDPSDGSDRGLKKRKTSKDAAPAIEEPEFEVRDSDMPQDQEENPGNDDEEPKEKVASKRDWFTKPSQPQEPTNPDWNVGKTPQQGQNQSWLMTLASSAEKPSKTFNELISTLIDFFAFIMNGLKINNLTQETLLGLAFRLLKGTRSNYAELEYVFEECHKALLEKLN
ncbi:hypothetical protein Tco_0267113 [Tanacetum coccineum]